MKVSGALAVLLFGVSSSRGDAVHHIFWEADEAFTCPSADNKTLGQTCECRHNQECNAGDDTTTLVCRNAGDCNCGSVDLCICENVGFCACEDAKTCFCNSIGDCSHKPESPPYLWECPTDWTVEANKPTEMPMFCDDKGCRDVIPSFRHDEGDNACHALGCSKAWDCDHHNGECAVVDADGAPCNQRERLHMQGHVTKDGKNPCGHCPPETRGTFTNVGKRCNAECFANPDNFGSPAAALQMNWGLVTLTAAATLLARL